MSTSNTGNKTHDDTVRVAEGVRQSAVAGAATQTAVIAAEIVFYRAGLASAFANGCNPVPFIRALQNLGTGGA